MVARTGSVLSLLGLAIPANAMLWPILLSPLKCKANLSPSLELGCSIVGSLGLGWWPSPLEIDDLAVSILEAVYNIPSIILGRLSTRKL